MMGGAVDTVVRAAPACRVIRGIHRAAYELKQTWLCFLGASKTAQQTHVGLAREWLVCDFEKPTITS